MSAEVDPAFASAHAAWRPDGPARRTLKVTVVSMAREVWGSEASVLRLAPLLAERRVEVTVAAPIEGEFSTTAEAAGISVVDLQLPPHRGVVARLPSHASAVRNALREISQVAEGVRVVARATEGADVVHSNSLLTSMDCAIAGRLHQRPTLIEIHDLVRPGLSKHLLSACLRLSWGAIAISTPVAERVDSWASRRVHLVPQAVDTDVYSPSRSVVCVRAELTAQPLEPVIAIVGRIDPEKGVPTVVSAVRSLNDAGLRCSLVVVGASSRGHECYQAETIAAATATLGDRVRFVGIRADIVEVLRSVDVLVNASDAEPFGLSVLEAQACGVPVVCANAGGIPDFVADGTTGLLFSAGRAGQLAAALSRLFRTAGLAERLATAGVKQVHEQYSLPARADAIAGIYRQATGRHWPHLSARGAGRSSSMARPNSVTSYFRDQYDHSR